MRHILLFISLISYQATAEVSNKACDNPYYTTIVDGLMVSGSSKTAQQVYYETAEEYKRVLYDVSLTEKERWKRLDMHHATMQRMQKLRCHCLRDVNMVPKK